MYFSFVINHTENLQSPRDDSIQHNDTDDLKMTFFGKHEQTHSCDT